VKRKRFAVEQIVAVLKQAEAGLPVAELIRKLGISEQTFYRWKRQCFIQPNNTRVNRRRHARSYMAYRLGNNRNIQR